MTTCFIITKLKKKKKKKRRLSTSTRFRNPVTEVELETAAKATDNTKRCNYLAEKIFSDWAKSRCEKFPKEPIPDNQLSCNDAVLVNKWFCHCSRNTAGIW